MSELKGEQGMLLKTLQANVAKHCDAAIQEAYAAIQEAYNKGLNEGIASESAYRQGIKDGVAIKSQEGTFEWAMQQMRQGQAVKRKSYPWHLQIRDSFLRIGPRHQGDDLSLGHIVANDWEIIAEPQPEGHDFTWALIQVNSGKSVKRLATSFVFTPDTKFGSLTTEAVRAKDWVLASTEER